MAEDHDQVLVGSGKPNEGATSPDIHIKTFRASDFTQLRTDALEDFIGVLTKSNTAFTETVGVPFHAAVDQGRENASDMKLSEPVRKEVNTLLEKRLEMISQIDRVQKHVDSPLLKQLGETIKQTYERADKLAEENGITDPFDRAALRVWAMGGKILPITDFDGTMTDGDEHIKKMPTQSLEELLKEEKLGRGRFIDATLPAVHRVKKNFDAMYQVGAEYVKMRPGVPEYIEYSNEVLGVEPIILTANYSQVPEGALSKIPEADGRIRIVAVTENSVVSTSKGVVLEYFARTNPGHAIAFSCDGDSDSPALDANENVAFFMALRGGGAEKLCIERGLLYFPYNDLEEQVGIINTILQHSQDIQRLVNQ